jgi:tripartite-type tricarboxylate transporter receptor subunit TctC
MTSIFRTIATAIAICAALAATGPTSAQGYPARPVTIVVPFSPGGTTDIVTRIVMTELGERLGQNVVVDNRPGAGGSIGWQFAARAPKDGYTLLATSTDFGMAPALLPNQPFDPRKDFEHVSLTATGPFIIVVNSAVPAKTLQEFIALEKSRRGRLNYGSGGSGSASHLAGEWFKMLTSTHLLHIPYRGGAPAIQALLAGEVEVAFLAIPSVLQHVRSGKLRALAITGDSRVALLPEVPTTKEAGLPQMRGGNWIGLAAPAGTPTAIVHRLNQQISALLATPRMRERLIEAGVEPASALPPEKVAAHVDAEITQWTAVVTAGKIKPE